MLINVKFYDDLFLDIDVDSTVLELKEKVKTDTSIPVKDQKLCCKRETYIEMENTKTLKDYEIKEKEEILLLPRLNIKNFKNNENIIIKGNKVTYKGKY